MALESTVSQCLLNLLGHPVKELATTSLSDLFVNLIALHSHDTHVFGVWLSSIELDESNAKGRSTDIECEIGSPFEAGWQCVVVRRQHADLASLQFGGELLDQLG